MDGALLLASPMVIFFVVGAFFAAISREVQLPPLVSRIFAMLMLFAIGVKGGASLGGHGLDGRVLTVIIAGIALSVAMTLLAFATLCRATSVRQHDAAGIAAHYGSISIVTFATMTLMLKAEGVAYDGWMVSLAALMEIPAILTALVLARLAVSSSDVTVEMAEGGGAATMGSGASGGAAAEGGGFGASIAAVVQNPGVQLLVGAFAVGWLAGEINAGWDEDISTGLFPVVVCLFLLDQGISVGRRLASLRRRFDKRLAVFALAMPVIGAIAGLITGLVLGLSAGNTALMMALAGSASYIAAPAATRVALPGARPELYLTLSLCMTLPFNLLIGLPLWLALATWLAG
ncbi:MAG: sodium-dependent bicarbonate transport family permease [Pseudomonadota bacterium]